MLFSSMTFLWIFLPITLITYFIIPTKYKNFLLLFASLFFYAWGEPKYIILMLISIFANYMFGILVENSNIKTAKIYLLLAVVFNLGFLSYFKYYNFILETINSLFSTSISFISIALPIGISFYTFQSMSYVIDIYRSKKENGTLKAQRNIFNLALYISLFPQLIAGPIVKYHEVDEQLKSRTTTVDDFAYGVKRFIYGFSKKILISNSMASVVDVIFDINPSELGTLVAWLGIICYALQIYFDFSGYSDMAIGLGRIFGFRFMENFNYPYISKSIQEFWRRWHISLSTWFKEYLYIPLGGNRKGAFLTYVNLSIVFLATGIWHGASYNFIIWGAFHGLFIVLERLFLSKVLKRNPLQFLNNIYTLLVVLIGWVFFRAETLAVALNYLYKMFVFTAGTTYNIGYFLNIKTILIIVIAIAFSGFLQSKFKKLQNALFNEKETSYIQIVLLVTLFLISIVNLASDAYNPFIYFRF